MGFRFVEDITTADVAFEAKGKDLTELFQSAAQAVIESMANPKTIKPVIVKEIKKKNKDVEKLLFEFLEEIVYLKDRDAMVFGEIKVKVEVPDNYSETIKYEGHEIVYPFRLAIKTKAIKAIREL